MKAVESEPHVDGLCGEPELDGGRETQHDASRASEKSVRRDWASAGTRMTIPLGKVTSTGGDGGVSATVIGTKVGVVGVVGSTASRRFQR